MFVLFPVRPTFDLETKKSFCRVSDCVLAHGGNRFSQFGLFHTVQKRHFSVRRSNLTLAARSWVQQRAKIFPRSHFECPGTIFGTRPVGFSSVEKKFVDRKIISTTGSFLLAFSEWKAFPILSS